MLQSTFDKRTARLSKNSMAYKSVKELLSGTEMIRPCYTSGSGKWSAITDKTDEILQALKLAGLKENKDFTIGNDAPKGGKLGQFITLTATGRKKRIK